jgi:hypothetical protein
MNPFDILFDGIDAGVETLFSIHNIALWLAFALFGWCAGIILLNRRRHYRPFLDRLEERLAATDFLDAADSDAEARTAFADHLPQVEAAMTGRGLHSGGLRHAWSQFRGTLLDPQERPLRATMPPEEYFLGLGEETRVLAWWANIFVAVGLTFTFLGIIAALLRAVQAMGASADPANMQVALVGLLHITAAKFWTSIGGVASSIILRVFDRRWHSVTEARLERLCERLERGTVFTSPQQLALAQIHLLEGRTPATIATPADEGSRAAIERLVEDLTGQIATLQASRDGGAAGGSAELAAAARDLSAAAGQIVDAVSASTALDGVTARDTHTRAAMVADTAGEVQATLATLGHAATEMAGVVLPIRDGARQIAEASAALEEAVRVADARAARTEQAVEGIVASLEHTSASAERAWQSYRDRFEAVDVALARALDSIGASSIEHADALTGQVGRIDAALGQAVDRLASALEGIGDLVAALDDMRGELKARRAR